MVDDRSELLDVYLHEAAQAREDDRYAVNALATLMTIALPFIGAVAIVGSQTCAEGFDGCPISGQYAIPLWMYLAGPIFPAGLLAYAITIATLSTLRTYYIRVIETKIHELTRQDDSLPMPSWGTSPWRSWGGLASRFSPGSTGS